MHGERNGDGGISFVGTSYDGSASLKDLALHKEITILGRLRKKGGRPCFEPLRDEWDSIFCRETYRVIGCQFDDCGADGQ